MVLKIGGLGDILMATPAVRALKKSCPDARVTFLVGRSNKQVMADNPYVDNLLDIDDRTIFKTGLSGGPLVEALRVVRRIRQLKPDEIFVLHRAWQWNLLAKMAGVPIRYGFQRDLRGSFLTHATPSPTGMHETLRYLKVFGQKPGFHADGPEMNLFPNRGDASRVAQITSLCRGRRLIAVAPGGAMNVKEQRSISRWPLASYEALIRRLLAETECMVVLIGGAGDRPFTDALRLDPFRVIDTAGILNLQQSYLLLKCAHAMVTHDCGPMHLGAAARIPVVSLFGPTLPAEKAPITNRLSIALWKGSEMRCSPCYQDGRFPDCRSTECMCRISPDEVLRHILEILDNMEHAMDHVDC
jgi:ADP-heptose:LPS heptosyltransferase